jgi:hypothetical protein
MNIKNTKHLNEGILILETLRPTICEVNQFAPYKTKFTC